MIGLQLIDLLVKYNAEVICSDIKKSLFLPDGVTYCPVDLRDYRSCLDLCREVDVVFNLVGIKCSPRVTQEQPQKICGPMLQINTNMIEAAMQNKVQWFLYTSTVGIYNPKEILYEVDAWDGPPSKNDYYGGWAKRIGELHIESYKKSGFSNFSIVRPANVFGPNDNFDLDSAMVIPSLIRKAYSNNVLSVWGDGSAVRDFIYCKDVAKAMIFVVENEISEPVNVGSGTGYSIKELAQKISSKAGIEIEWDTNQPTGDKKRILSIERLRNYGFTDILTLDEALDKTIDWYLANKEFANTAIDTFKRIDLANML
jgi:GDP-L-fucose synthase